MVIHILVNCFQIIWDLGNLLDRTILIDYLVFQNRRPDTYLSQIMEKMLVYYDKLTTATKKINQRTPNIITPKLGAADMLTLKLFDCIYLMCTVQSTHCCQEFGQWKQWAQEQQEESSSIQLEKSPPLLLTSSICLMALHSTYQVEECPAEMQMKCTENQSFHNLSAYQG